MTRLLSGPAGRLRLCLGDLTEFEADALINAANSQLRRGGGVDGAIHRAAGPQLQLELERNHPGGCEVGKAVISGAGRLRARFVIHAVGPIWRGGGQGEEELLAGAYRSAFQLAAEKGCATVASCSISTGIFGFPVELAAPIALGAALEHLEREPGQVSFVLFGERDLERFAAELERVAAGGEPALRR